MQIDSITFAITLKKKLSLFEMILKYEAKDNFFARNELKYNNINISAI